MSLRRTVMGLATVLGLARKGFFIPYRYAHALPRPGARAPYAILGELLSLTRPIATPARVAIQLIVECGSRATALVGYFCHGPLGFS